MKTEKYIITNHLQEILDNKHIPLDAFVKYATAYGLSRAVVYKIAANYHYSMKETISHKLQVLLKVQHDELITWQPNMETLFDDDQRGFTVDHLKILSGEMSNRGIDLQYQVYSQNGAMNVTTKYARNRRMYLDGNFRINTNGLPELSLINFDIVNNRMDTTAAELSNFQFQLLKGIIRFAEKINVYKIDYFATDSDSQQKGAYVSLKQKAEICKTLGFEEFTHDLDRVQKHFVKKLLN